MTSNPVETTFNRLRGELCWGIEYSAQLNLSMSFGSPRLKIRDPYETASATEAIRRSARRRNVTIKGQWWLWLQCCFWRITRDGAVLATQASSRRKRQDAFFDLEGQRLISVSVHPLTGRTRLEFDLGCALECRRFSKADDSQMWTLYEEPGGNALSVYPDGTYAYHPDSTAIDEVFRSPPLKQD